MAAPRLLKAYRTPPGTNETTPRTVTFDFASTAGTTLFALIPCSVVPSLNSPWTQIAGDAGNTVMRVFKLAAADNPGGVSSLTVTQSSPGYPFSCLVFEDRVSSITSTPTPGQVTPSGTLWSAGTATFATGHRVVGYWNALRFQGPTDGDITAYSLGMVEIGDTDVSSEFNGSHAAWYTCRTWAAWVDDLSGSQTLNATETITNAAASSWTGYLYYVVAPDPLSVPTATVTVDAIVPALILPLLLTVPTATVSVAAYAPDAIIPLPLHLTIPTAAVSVDAYAPAAIIPLPTLTVPTAAISVAAYTVAPDFGEIIHLPTAIVLVAARTVSLNVPGPTVPLPLEPGACRTRYGIDLRVQLGIGRQEGAGFWDTSYWDLAVWSQTDTELGDWVDVGKFVEDPFKLQAGTNDADGIVTRWEAATCYMTLWGREWDPWDGPYKGIVGPGIGVRVLWRKVFAPIDEPWRYAFRGSVASNGWEWTPGPKHDFVNVSASDLTEILVAYDAVPGALVGDGDLASMRVSRILDLAEWPNDSAHRDIEAGGITNQPTNLGGIAWEQLLLTADTDLGLGWFSRAGVFTYRPTARTGENIRDGAWSFVVCLPE